MPSKSVDISNEKEKKICAKITDFHQRAILATNYRDGKIIDTKSTLMTG